MRVQITGQAYLVNTDTPVGNPRTEVFDTRDENSIFYGVKSLSEVQGDYLAYWNSDPAKNNGEEIIIVKFNVVH